MLLRLALRLPSILAAVTGSRVIVGVVPDTEQVFGLLAADVVHDFHFVLLGYLSDHLNERLALDLARVEGLDFLNQILPLPDLLLLELLQLHEHANRALPLLPRLHVRRLRLHTQIIFSFLRVRALEGAVVAAALSALLKKGQVLFDALFVCASMGIQVLGGTLA